MGSTRTSVVLALAFTAYWVVALRLDAWTDSVAQAWLGVTAWVFLALALRLSPREQRVQVLTMVAVATFFEMIGSLLWGAYRYRLENLPLYVPAGHGLFYLVALRLAQLASLRRRERPIVLVTLAFATSLMLRGLLAGPLPDLLGFVTWAVFVRFLLRGRFPLLYAVSFVMTMVLEFYGTGLGIWRWAPVLPVLWLPAGNPPAGIGAGYCAMDGLARRLAPRAAGLILAGRRRLAAAQA